MNDEFRPILAFPVETAEFALGFEAGVIWRGLTAWDDSREFEALDAHAANGELFLRMGEATSRAVSWVEREGGQWVDVTFSTAEAAA